MLNMNSVIQGMFRSKVNKSQIQDIDGDELLTLYPRGAKPHDLEMILCFPQKVDRYLQAFLNSAGKRRINGEELGAKY